MKNPPRKGRKQAELRKHPVDNLSVRDLVSSEDTTQSSYLWDSQDDPYALVVEDGPVQPYQQPEQETEPSIKGRTQACSGEGVMTEAAAVSSGATQEATAVRQVSAPLPKGKIGAGGPSRGEQCPAVLPGKRKAASQSGDSKGKLLQALQVGALTDPPLPLQLLSTQQDAKSP